LIPGELPQKGLRPKKRGGERRKIYINRTFVDEKRGQNLPGYLGKNGKKWKISH